MSSRPTLDFLIFYVSDLDEATRYFTQTLGLELDPAQNGPVFRAFVGSEGVTPFALALVNETNSPEARRPGNVEVYFKTDDFEGKHTELAERGVPITEIAHRPFGSIFSIPAPDGHIVTMLSTPAQ